MKTALKSQSVDLSDSQLFLTCVHLYLIPQWLLWTPLVRRLIFLLNDHLSSFSSASKLRPNHHQSPPRMPPLLVAAASIVIIVTNTAETIHKCWVMVQANIRLREKRDHTNHTVINWGYAYVGCKKLKATISQERGNLGQCLSSRHWKITTTTNRTNEDRLNRTYGGTSVTWIPAMKFLGWMISTAHRNLISEFL